MSADIDRAKVLRFFTWKNRELAPLLAAVGCMAIASWITYLGVAVAVRNAERAGILLFTSTAAAAFLAIAVLSVRSALKGDKALHEFHEEVKKAKAFDFGRLIVRSFHKAEASLDALLDFDHTAVAAAIPPHGGPADRQLLKALQHKTILLSGHQENTGFLKFLFNAGELSVEYSPISVAILYLTRSELIVCLASADVVTGGASTAEIQRIPLKNVVDVTLEAASRRIGSAGNERLFREYERVVRNNPSPEILSLEKSVRVVRADGPDLVLPAGDPVYRRGARKIVDAAQEDRFSHIAREISRRIADAKAAAAGGLHQEL